MTRDDAVRRVVGAAVLTVVALEAFDDVRELRRRARTSTSSWWRAIERRERQSIHRSELLWLLRRLPPSP